MLESPSLRALAARAAVEHSGAVRIAAMGKHLCGSACDLALRCCVRASATAAADAATSVVATGVAKSAANCAAARADGGVCDCGAPGCGTSDFGPESIAALGLFFARMEAAPGAGGKAAADGARAMAEAEAQTRAAAAGEARIEWGGAAFATCCHHFCDWATFVDTPFLSSFGIDAGEFAVMRRTTTRYRVRVSGGSRGATAQRSAAARLAAMQAELGVLSKRLIDETRARWLSRKLAALAPRGAKVRLLRYCMDEVSPESTLLLWSSVEELAPPAAASVLPEVVAV